MVKVTATKRQYDEAFEAERAREYPMVSDFELKTGYSIDRHWLEEAARVLACPVKKNPPNWQHGRVLYSALRCYLASFVDAAPVRVLDIGTAKGFSALCMQRAIMESGSDGEVTSIDVIDPSAEVVRNTVGEVNGLVTLYDLLLPWPEASFIKFLWGKGENWFVVNRKRVNFAFVDGKHTFEAVARELKGLAGCQQSGDVIVCDDLQVSGVSKAVDGIPGDYKRIDLWLNSDRGYAILERR